MYFLKNLILFLLFQMSKSKEVNIEDEENKDLDLICDIKQEVYLVNVDANIVIKRKTYMFFFAVNRNEK